MRLFFPFFVYFSLCVHASFICAPARIIFSDRAAWPHCATAPIVARSASRRERVCPCDQRARAAARAENDQAGVHGKCQATPRVGFFDPAAPDLRLSSHSLTNHLAHASPCAYPPPLLAASPLHRHARSRTLAVLVGAHLDLPAQQKRIVEKLNSFCSFTRR